MPPLVPHPGEPEAGPWRVRPLADVVADVRAAAGSPPGRAPVVAVDGRSAGGKSTFAQRLVDAVPGACLVHTDDVAWWESFFGWDHLMADGVLGPARRREPVAFRPPAWDARDRDGAIEVPADATLVVVEGVGAARGSLGGLVDAVVWVQSDAAEARRRGIERDGGPSAEGFWDEWQSQEVPFLLAERPWERAHVVVCGTPELVGRAPTGAQVVTGRSPGAGGEGP